MSLLVGVLSIVLLLPVMLGGISAEASDLPDLEPLKIANPKMRKDHSELQSRLNLNPSLTTIQGRALQSAAGMLKAQYSLEYRDLRLYLDGWLEVDLASAAEFRRAEKSVALQEAYGEWRHGSFFFRAGRQSLRWSESWSIPSLDLWTSRRYSRLFFDFLTEQLIHPTGILASWSMPAASFEFFQNLQPAVHELPRPLPESDREWRNEWGVRGKARMGSGFDLGAIFAEKNAEHSYGASLSYALDFFVPKIEVGSNRDHENFATAGIDFFFGNFSFIPQVTRYRATILDPGADPHHYANNFYLLARWDDQPNLIEAQLFYDDDSHGEFYSVLYSRTVSSTFQISGFFQSYSGNFGTLFGLYESMTDGPVLGLRLAMQL